MIGVDFGRRDIAVTSTGQSWSGKDINNTRDKYSRVRASVQKKASQGKSASPGETPGVYAGRTRSTRRRCRETLKRLSGREKRYQQWLNHNISIAIIREAIATNSTVAIEDLTGIRERTNDKPRSQTERRRSNSWAFYQLRTFLEYKGIKEGVNVITIPPAYTSQTCHKCLHVHPVKGKSYRSGKNFKCGNCGEICDADFNGSKMIELWGASVTAPGGKRGAQATPTELLSCAVTPGRLFARTIA